MTWNHRIVKYDSGEYGLHEVYYDAEGRPEMRTDKAIAVSESPAGILDALQMMIRDAEKNQEEQDIIDDAQAPWHP